MPSKTQNCKNCKQSFEIMPEDGVFYTKLNVPPPTWCPDRPFYERIAHRPNEFETPYAPNRKEIVYCDPCYKAEVI